MSDLYHTRVLELAADIPHLGRLSNPHGSAHKVSRLCGSEMDVDVMLEGGCITGFAIDPRACALGQASASVLARSAIGAQVQEVAQARQALLGMLKENGAPPTGRFWELRHLAGVADYPARHQSVLLAFDTALAAIAAAGAGIPAPHWSQGDQNLGVRDE